MQANTKINKVNVLKNQLEFLKVKMLSQGLNQYERNYKEKLMEDLYDEEIKIEFEELDNKKKKTKLTDYEEKNYNVIKEQLIFINKKDILKKLQLKKLSRKLDKKELVLVEQLKQELDNMEEVKSKRYSLISKGIFY